MIRERTITRGENRMRNWPFDPKCWVIPPDSPSMVGLIAGGDLVRNFRAVDQCLKTVCETFRHVQHPAVFGSEFGGNPLAIGRGGGAKVDNYVIDSARAATDELGFGVWFRLVMQSAEGASPCIPGNAALNEFGIQPKPFEFFSAPGSCEETPFIGDELHFNQISSAQRKIDEFHSTTSGVGMGIINLPPQRRTSASCPIISSRRFQGRIKT